MSSQRIYAVGRVSVSSAARLCHRSQTTIEVAGRRLYASGFSPAPRRSTSQLLTYAVGLGGIAGGGYAAYAGLTKPTDQTTAARSQAAVFIDKLPNVKITRKLHNPRDKSGLDLVLFQYQTCPFCCKVRAFLDSQGLSYSVVEVDAVLRQSIKWSAYKKVPMLLVKCKDGRYLQLTESSMIVSILASYLAAPGQDVADLYTFYPTESFVDADGKEKSEVLNKYFLMFQDQAVPKGRSKENMEEERKWRAWADSHLVHLISPNVYQTWPEALETFEWFAKTGEWDANFPRWERNMMVYVGAGAMWAISKRLKKRHNLSDDVRWHIYNACDKWTVEITKKNTKFHGGKVPNLADISVFGILSSMEGCQAFKDCLKNSNIGPWFAAMKEYVAHHQSTIISPVDVEQVVQFS